MIWLLFFVFAVAFYLSVIVRVICFHPFKTIRYAITDFYKYLRFKTWRLCVDYGRIICFVGLFGKGKTLSAVHWIVSHYKKYNGLKVYDFARRKWVTQVVHVISNVDLTIPYEKFVSMTQLLRVAEKTREEDEKNDTLTITLVLGDEFSTQLNSRSFKENFSTPLLGTLLTCRHHHICLVYTTQRFCHVDKLLREVTSFVVDCNKVWRFMVHGQFDAFELENATSIQMVRPLMRYGWFITDRDFNNYDTLACVDQLSKSCKEGDMLSDEEILALLCNSPSDMDSVEKPSRRYFRNSRKSRK